MRPAPAVRPSASAPTAERLRWKIARGLDLPPELLADLAPVDVNHWRAFTLPSTFRPTAPCSIGPFRVSVGGHVTVQPRRPYDWQRDERDPIAEARALFDQGVVPAADWRAEALGHLRAEAATFRAAVAATTPARLAPFPPLHPSADPLNHGPGAIATAPIEVLRFSLDLRAVEALG